MNGIIYLIRISEDYFSILQEKYGEVIFKLFIMMKHEGVEPELSRWCPKLIIDYIGYQVFNGSAEDDEQEQFLNDSVSPFANCLSLDKLITNEIDESRVHSNSWIYYSIIILIML